MLSYERQNQILELLRQRRCATVEYLAKHLYSSSATIRRDLAAMDKKGLINRVRGGATLPGGAHTDEPLPVRAGKDQQKKEIIAHLALPFIKSSSALFMDSSSTVSVLAKRLEPFDDLTIVTNGVVTMNLLNDLTTARVYSTGGLIRNNSSFIGQTAVDTVSSFRVDVCFFSCCGLSLSGGITEANEENAAVKRAMLSHARQKILLCDSSKFGESFFCRCVDLSEVDVIITDTKPGEEFRMAAGCRVIFP